MILPIGVRGQAEANDVVKGSEPGAPVETNIKAKFKLTSIVATVIWVIVCSIIWSGLISWEQLGGLIGLSPSPK